MEYEKLYLKTFDEVHSNTENYIKNKLIESINNDYGFNEASNVILKESEKNFENNKFNTTKPYTELIYIFNNERKKYSKNSYENVFKRDVKPVFDNLNIKEYSFEDLIEDLAKYYSETNTYRIFRNENRLFILIYKSEDFSKFEIKEYDTGLENTEIFRYYYQLVNPEKNSQDNITNDIGNNSSINNKTKSLEEDKTKIILTSEENCLLIYLFNKIMSKKGFDTSAEVYKILSLIKVKQLSEFGNKDSYRSTNEYKVIGGKLNNINLNDIACNNKQLKREYYKLLNKLSNKIKSQKMDKINEEIANLIEYIQPQII